MGLLGGLIQGAIGIRQGKKQRAEGKSLIREAEGINIEQQDASRMMAGRELVSRSNQMYNGTGTLSALLGKSIDNNFATIANSVQSLAGGGGADVTGLLAAQKNAQDAYGAGLATIADKSLQTRAMGEEILGEQSQRALELGLLKKNQLMARGLDAQQTGEQNIQAGVGAISKGLNDTAQMATSLFTAGVLGNKKEEVA